MEQLRSIQALRALAALAVMMAHLHGIETRQAGEPHLLSAAWLSGVSGVDLFFVISGFIMVWIAGDAAPGFKSTLKFLFARFMRIYPLWWLFAGAMCAYLFMAYGVPWDAEVLAVTETAATEHLWKSFLLVPHDAFPVLALGWTLMHEIYFYLVFGLLLLLPRPFRLVGFLCWGVIICLSIAFEMTGFYANSWLSLALFPMTLEFLMGVGVALLIKAKLIQFKWIALAVGLAWLGGALLYVDFSNSVPNLPTQRTLAFGPAFALLIYALVSIEQTTRLGQLIPDVLVRIGDWSYSLYLGHLLVISAFARLYFPLFGQPGYLDNTIFLVLGSVTALVSAALAYHLFELPILRATRRARSAWFGPTPPPTN